MVKIEENGGSPPEVVEAPALCDSGRGEGGEALGVVEVPPLCDSGAVKGGIPLTLALVLPVCDSADGISVKVLSTAEPVEGVEGAIETPVAGGDGASDLRRSSPGPSGPRSSQAL